jgi:hypothetical protein
MGDTKRRTLHFFPGMKRLYLFVDGVPAREAEAWGGPPKEIVTPVMNAADRLG